MKLLYNILAAIVWIGIAFILLPVLVFMTQLLITLFIIIAELLVFPFCIFLVYLAWKATQSNS